MVCCGSAWDGCWKAMRPGPCFQSKYWGMGYVSAGLKLLLISSLVLVYDFWVMRGKNKVQKKHKELGSQPEWIVPPLSRSISAPSCGFLQHALQSLWMVIIKDMSLVEQEQRTNSRLFDFATLAISQCSWSQHSAACLGSSTQHHATVSGWIGHTILLLKARAKTRITSVINIHQFCFTSLWSIELTPHLLFSYTIPLDYF